jgi:hypothetical protein
MDARIVLASIPNARDRLAIRDSFYPEYPERQLWTGTTVCIDEETFDDLLETLAALGPVRRMTSLEVTVRRREGNNTTEIASKALDLLCGIIDSCSDELDHVVIEFPPESIDMPTAQCAELLGSLARLPAATFVSVRGLVLTADDLREWGPRPFPDHLVITDCGLDVGRTRPVLTFDAFHGKTGIAHVRLNAQYRQHPVVIGMILTRFSAHIYHSLDPETDMLDCYWNMKLDFAFSYLVLLLEVL